MLIPLRKLSFELDSQFGLIGARVSTLADVECLFGQLVDEMNIALYRGEEHARLYEHHRKIRVYWELIRYTLNDLSKDYEKAHDLHEKMFPQIVGAEGDQNNE